MNDTVNYTVLLITAFSAKRSTLRHKVKLAIDHVLFCEICGFSQGNYPHIYLHLPTNGYTNKPTNV